MTRLLISRILALAIVVLSASATIHYTGQVKKGVDFMVTGDFGTCTNNMEHARNTFGVLDQMLGNATNETNPEDLLDFILLAGDNLYPEHNFAPKDEEFQMLLELFQTENFKNLDLYPVRGNHDCKFHWEMELELVDDYEHWKMPYLYYKQEFDIGNDKKLGVLFIDSCLIVCSDYNIIEGTRDYMILPICTPTERVKGNEQYEFIFATLAEWEADPSVVWKGTIAHHAMFGKYYHDNIWIVDNYLPLLLMNEFDFYMNGHEHVLMYANYPYSQNYFDEEQQPQLQGYYECQKHVEMHFGHTETVIEYEQGSHLHCVTSGASGKGGYELCATQPSAGHFHYGQNKYYGWVQFHVDEDEAVIRYRGLEDETNELIELYEVRIKARGAKEDTQ